MNRNHILASNNRKRGFVFLRKTGRQPCCDDRRDPFEDGWTYSGGYNLGLCNQLGKSRIVGRHRRTRTYVLFNTLFRYVLDDILTTIPKLPHQFTIYVDKHHHGCSKPYDHR